MMKVRVQCSTGELEMTTEGADVKSELRELGTVDDAW